jgi:uncharacterized protein (UPF0303 family)
MILRAEQLKLLKRKATTANKFKCSVFRATITLCDDDDNFED